MKNRNILIVAVCLVLSIVSVGVGILIGVNNANKRKNVYIADPIVTSSSSDEKWEEVTEADANGMKLNHYTGELYLTSSSSTDEEVYEGRILSDGDRVNTETESYAWIDLDMSKEVKMDEVSQTVLNSADRKLRILLEEGNLFFRIKELEEDESMDFVMSNATCSIKGTSGILETVSDTESRLLLLKGEVKVETPDGETLTAMPGDLVTIETEGDNSYRVSVRQITEEDIPSFAREELNAEEEEYIAEVSEEEPEEVAEPVVTLMDQYGDFEAVSVGNLVDQGEYYSATAQIYVKLPTSTDWPGDLVGTEEVKIAKNAVVHWFDQSDASGDGWIRQDVTLDEYVHWYGRDYSTAYLRMMGRDGWANGNTPIEYNAKGYIIGFYDAAAS